MGNALAELQHFEEAAFHYRRALDARPDYEHARDNLRIVMESLKDGE